MVSVRRAAPWVGAFLCAASSTGAGELLDPLSAAVLHAPIPVRGDDGTTHLAYELHVTNMTSEPLTLERVEVLDAGGLLRRLEDGELAESFRAFGVTRPVWESSARADRLTLAAGMSGFLYLWVTAPEQRAFASPLRHRIVVANGTGRVRTGTAIEPRPAALASRPVLTIGPPVRGGPWLASNGPSNASGHRRLPITRHGRLTVFQRYAIDYLKLDARGRSHAGDWQANASHFTQGEEAIAVADSVVVSVRDGLPENVPDELPEGGAPSLDTVYGNAVILDLGQGQYAVYAHLLPGSLRVKPGDHVLRGQTLGRIGNTGNSLQPHLHFQIADSPETLSGEGLPYVHDRFNWAGSCPGGDEPEAPPCELAPPRPVSDSIPLGGSVVIFP